jgi:3-deoxy-manno-octulosonate cytidylyltransferase (CMP-KDO synthetase)
MLHSSFSFAVVVPARKGSTRFPNKPLATLGVQTLIECVLDRLISFCPAECILLATDDEEIAAKAQGRVRAVMTDSDLPSGTDRCHAAVQIAGIQADIVLNVQGDEPFVQESQLQALLDLFQHPDTQIGTLACPGNAEDLSNPNAVKAVCRTDGFALYFSRSPIPHVRSGLSDSCLRHLGLYAFRQGILEELARLSPSPLEQSESLEQLRWLENGYAIRIGLSQAPGISVDTPDDLLRAQALWQSLNH